ncbi:MAG: peptidoglycan DD-metalloendopeptidase family protein [Gammaproteobacteria bacterium]|nr:peptidoglycan DD-metalloendopeptidase family protein [Gammaproteobacteria bacterium]
MRVLSFRSLIASLILLASACSSAFLTWEQDHYTVREGDTLYAIAWRHEIDYRRLAQWNHMNVNATLNPGQVLIVSPTATRMQAQPAAARRTQTASTGTAKPRKSPSGQPSLMAASLSNIKWHWPSNGSVVTTFADDTSLGRGIDIGGAIGESVNAAADGEVVYAGDGLIGYGHVAIIKHDAHWLSAYGYNQKLLVREGDVVQTGQRIALVGQQPNASPSEEGGRLHFEIRYQGEPVDPLRLLPKR